MSAAAKLAASYFNHGASSYYRLMKLAGCPGGAHTLAICHSLNDKREYFAARKNDGTVKAAKSKQKIYKKEQEEDSERRKTVPGWRVWRR